jgi:hypothetical protein
MVPGDPPIVTVPGHPPVVASETPTPGSLFRAGEVISFSADATDAEDCTLPDSAFSWKVPRGTCR